MTTTSPTAADLAKSVAVLGECAYQFVNAVAELCKKEPTSREDWLRGRAERGLRNRAETRQLYIDAGLDDNEVFDVLDREDAHDRYVLELSPEELQVYARRYEEWVSEICPEFSTD